MPQLLERRHTMGGKSLPYACELTYIESTGTQYIDTGIKLYEDSSGNYQIDMKVYVPHSEQTTNYACVLNAMEEISPYPGMVIRWDNNYTSYIRKAGGGTDGSNVGSADTIATLNVTVTNDNAYHTVSTTLFAGYDGSGNPWRFIKMKLYYCKIYNKGVLVRDFIPVKKKDGTGCLYDKVTKTFFENKGTGSFTLGDCKIVPKGIVGEFEYTGAVQQKTLNKGKYLLQCWGAQGGTYSSYIGGRGAYSEGVLTLSTQTTLYIYVGGSGSSTSTTAGYNGGGSGVSSGRGGGGSSDIRIGTDSLYARVIVAGGGGGAGITSANANPAGCGGGTYGCDGFYNYSTGQYTTGANRSGGGATQTSGGISWNSQSSTQGTFGKGGNASTYSCGGGGGGWYGGGGAYDNDSDSDGRWGGGGSSYVYKSDTASNYPSGCLLNSSYYLENAQTIAGNTSFTSVDGETETGHSGNGFVRISKA